MTYTMPKIDGRGPSGETVGQFDDIVIPKLVPADRKIAEAVQLAKGASLSEMVSEGWKINGGEIAEAQRRLMALISEHRESRKISQFEWLQPVRQSAGICPLPRSLEWNYLFWFGSFLI